MRIISGNSKSIIIKAPKGLPSRPTKDIVKESLFNILSNKLKFDELKVLDLFSGTGNISYEFSSRGSDYIISVDDNFKCVKFINKISKKNNFNIIAIRSDYKNFLLNTNENFDIIFADPPYIFSEKQYVELLNIIKQNDILLEDGEIIIEHSSKISFLERFNNINERIYGSTKLSFFKKASL